MWHMFDALHSEFIYVSRIGPHIWQGQLVDFNFAKPPSTRQSVLFRVFKVPTFITGNILIVCFILSRKGVCYIRYCIIQPGSVLLIR